MVILTTGSQVLVTKKDVNKVNLNSVAEWSSEIMRNTATSDPDLQDVACFSLNIKMYNYIRMISANLLYTNSTSHKLENRSVWSRDYDQMKWQLFVQVEDSIEISVKDVDQYQV